MFEVADFQDSILLTSVEEDTVLGLKKACGYLTQNNKSKEEFSDRSVFKEASCALPALRFVLAEKRDGSPSKYDGTSIQNLLNTGILPLRCLFHPFKQFSST